MLICFSIHPTCWVFHLTFILLVPSSLMLASKTGQAWVSKGKWEYSMSQLNSSISRVLNVKTRSASSAVPELTRLNVSSLNIEFWVVYEIWRRK